MKSNSIYVYTWFNEKYIAYYVGKNTCSKRDRHRQKHIRQNIPSPPTWDEHVQIIECDSEVEANGIEIALIEFYERKCDGGTLLNKSTGGHSGTNGIVRTSAERKEQSERTKLWINERGHPQLGKRGKASHNSLTYKVTDPSGKTQIVTGMTQFCRENNLNPTTMIRVSKGKQKTTRGGWTCIKLH